MSGTRRTRILKPTRSQKTTVTTFRSSRAVGGSNTRGTAQALQKRAPSGFWWPQLGQVTTTQAYGRSEHDSSVRGSDRSMQHENGPPMRAFL